MRKHSFYIPVMGTGFTIDSPIKVAPFGIDSVISLVDDNLIEKTREYYCQKHQLTYHPIPKNLDDSRAKRITEYLNLVNLLVNQKIEEIRAQSFEETSELVKYFELLANESPLKQAYNQMLDTQDLELRNNLQSELRRQVTPGSIDVNIMTKLDKDNYAKGEILPAHYSDAISALRGFAESRLSSAIVFSAGLNQRLYSAVSEFADFFRINGKDAKKKIIIKVSDYRSALTQGKIFAKKGIWVSEYRIESGINCGGHAFPGNGELLGTILAEFSDKKFELQEQLFETYKLALSKIGEDVDYAPQFSLTVQGGVGTNSEHRFLRRFYDVQEVGWGSLFLLVPEATSLDTATLQKLQAASESDISLSNSSPLGVPFYQLKNSASENLRNQRIAEGNPGSLCVNRFLAINKDYGEKSLCTASEKYQSRKIAELLKLELPEQEFDQEYRKITEKACICFDLGAGAMIEKGISSVNKILAPAVCPGPNLAFYSEVSSLQQMVDHIYGRAAISYRADRPNMFIKELQLYVQYLKDRVKEAIPTITEKSTKSLTEFKMNLIKGIAYYQSIANELLEEVQAARDCFQSELLRLTEDLSQIVIPLVEKDQCVNVGKL